MKLILAVLSIRMIVELLTRKRTGGNKDEITNNTGNVQHPAEYALR